MSGDATRNEIRRAYLKLVRQLHPDFGGPADTTRFSAVTAAYRELVRSEDGVSVGPDFDESTSDIDWADVTQRRDEFSIAYARHREHRDDTLAAVRLVRTAARANRLSDVRKLARSRAVIDTIELILVGAADAPAEASAVTAWADHLRSEGEMDLAARLLENAAACVDDIRFREQLSSIYYANAQGYSTGAKPPAAVRIDLLQRILRLRGGVDYVHKLLAEAFHETGEDESARAHLAQAYALTPDLQGAVKISRALGFARPSQAATGTLRSLRPDRPIFSNERELASPKELREWTASGEWSRIEPYVRVENFTPKLRPKARPLLVQAARSAAAFPSRSTVQALESLLLCVYWDVRRAAAASLAEVGDAGSVAALQAIQLSSGSDEMTMREAVRRLQSRLSGRPSGVVSTRAAADVKTARWNRLLSEGYDPSDDKGYLEELHGFEKQIRTADTAKQILDACRYLSRWLENLGGGALASWIQDLIRREAPGSWYCDPDRRRYIRSVTISSVMEVTLAELDEFLKSFLPHRMRVLIEQGAAGRERLEE